MKQKWLCAFPERDTYSSKIRDNSQNAVTINAQRLLRRPVKNRPRSKHGGHQMLWGLHLNTLQLSVVHRLPESYRWVAGLTGGVVEPHALNTLAAEDDLIGLRLLSHDGASAWDIMQKMRAMLADIQVDCAVIEWQGEPCLFVQRSDESAATVRLKNQGVAIAETFTAHVR